MQGKNNIIIFNYNKLHYFFVKDEYEFLFFFIRNYSQQLI